MPARPPPRRRPRSRAALLSRPWHGWSPGACAFRRPLVAADSAGEPPQPVKVGGAKRIRGEPQHALTAGRVDRKACRARPLLAVPAVGGGPPDTKDPVVDLMPAGHGSPPGRLAAPPAGRKLPGGPAHHL